MGSPLDVLYERRWLEGDLEPEPPPEHLGVCAGCGLDLYRWPESQYECGCHDEAPPELPADDLILVGGQDVMRMHEAWTWTRFDRLRQGHGS